MAIKIAESEYKLLVSIQNEKARGKNISEFNDVKNKAFARLCTAGFAETIDGYAYVTDKGIKKPKVMKHDML